MHHEGAGRSRPYDCDWQGKAADVNEPRSDHCARLPGYAAAATRVESDLIGLNRNSD